MTAGKRSDPKKLAREREAIARDIARRTPTAGAVKKPSKPSLVTRVASAVSEKVLQRNRRRAGYGPAPRVSGAMQSGFNKKAGRTA